MESRASVAVSGSVRPVPIQPSGSMEDPPPFADADAETYSSSQAYPRRPVLVQTSGSMRGFMVADVLVYPVT
jgi:hypothetical protein